MKGRALLLIVCSLSYVLAFSLQSPFSFCSGRKQATSTLLSLEPTDLDYEDTSKRRTKPRWITCSSSNEMAATVCGLVRPGDTVAELGTQLRNVSCSICDSLQGSGRRVGLKSPTTHLVATVGVQENKRPFPLPYNPATLAWRLAVISVH